MQKGKTTWLLNQLRSSWHRLGLWGQFWLGLVLSLCTMASFAIYFFADDPTGQIVNPYTPMLYISWVYLAFVGVYAISKETMDPALKNSISRPGIVVIIIWTLFCVFLGHYSFWEDVGRDFPPTLELTYSIVLGIFVSSTVSSAVRKKIKTLKYYVEKTRHSSSFSMVIPAVKKEISLNFRFWLGLILAVSCWLMFIVDFFNPGRYTVQVFLVGIYLFFVTAYTASKAMEARGNVKSRAKQHYLFVGIWNVLFYSIVVISFFSSKYEIPDYLFHAYFFVMCIFVASQYFKEKLKLDQAAEEQTDEARVVPGR